MDKHLQDDRARELLDGLKVRDTYALERLAAELKQRHEAGENSIKGLAELSGKSEERVIRIIGRIASLNEDLDWFRITYLVRAFFVTDQQIEDDKW